MVGELVNPYIAGAPVTEARMFFGREDVFDWIQNSLVGKYADHILVVHGQRRVGKTSVLKQLGNRLPQRYVPVFFDLQGRTHTTLDRFLWWLAREIVRVLKQDRGIEIPLPDKDAFASDIEYFEHRFLPDLKPALGNDTLLLTFDEFDNLEESEVKEELARPLTDYLRRLMGNTGLNFIFSIGSSGRKLENMQAAYTEFFKTALYKKISFLSEDQTRNLVTRPVENIIEYDKRAVARIYQLAGGHPYFTQLTCHELFARCQQSDERLIKEPDVESVLDDVVERGTVNLKFVWDEASDIEKWGLAALAQLDKTDNRSLVDYLKKQRIRFSETDLISGLLHLREKDVLTSENRFVIHLLKLWLQKNRPMEQAREELTEVNPIANRYIEIGLEFKDAGVYDKAIESFKEALNVAKDNVQAQVNIALTYMDQKAYSSAVVEFERALTMDDEDVSARAGLCEAHLALGDAAMQKGRSKDAIQSYQRVLAINAEHTEARQRMAELSRQRAEKAFVDGKDEDALSAFAEALKFTPEDPALIARVDSVRAEKKAKVLAALLARSEKEAGAKNWEGAIKSLEEALSFAPEDMSIQRKLSEVKAAQEKARLDALLAKADTAARSGRWNEAIEAYSAVNRAKPDETITARLEEVRAKQLEAQLNALRTQARTLAKAEKFDEALKVWQEVLSLALSDETATAEMDAVRSAQALSKAYAEAQKAYARKNYDQAVSLLKGIINQDENYRDASRLLAEAIELRRTARRWWQSKWLWGAVVGSVVLVVGWFVFRPGSPLMSALFATTAAPITNDAPGTVASNVGPATATVLVPPTVTPTPLPYSWARLNSGQFLRRDPINAIVIDPNDPGVIYVGTENAGVYKSIDGGVSWQPIHNGLGRAVVYSMVIDSQNSKNLYIGTSLGGVYKTVDGGMNWRDANQGILNRGWEAISFLSIDLNNGNNLMYTQFDELFASSDGGETWDLIKDSQICPTTIQVLAKNPEEGSIIYAATGPTELCPSGVYQSLDGGASWARLGPEETLLWIHEFYIDFHDTDRIYLNDVGSGTLYVSTDAGKTWKKKEVGCKAFALGPEENSEIYCARDGMFQKSTDGGDTWKEISELPETNVGVLSFSPRSSRTILLGGQGLWISVDGGLSWAESTNGLAVERVEMRADPVQASVLYLDDNLCQPYQSLDGGHNWISTQAWGCRVTMNGDGTARYWLDKNKRTIHTSIDSGMTWKEYSIPESTWQVFAHPMLPGTAYAVCAEAAPSCIHVSSDFGETWHRSTGLSKLVEGILFFGSDQGQRAYAVSRDFQVYWSNDSGETWKACAFTESYHAIGESRMAIDPRDANRLILATRGDGIKISQDGCNSWQPSNIGLGSLFVSTIAIDPNNPDTLYAGTDGGAYISFDGGETWGQINDGLLGATVVYSVVVDKDSSVYAATPYGIFKLEGK